MSSGGHGVMSHGVPGGIVQTNISNIKGTCVWTTTKVGHEIKMRCCQNAY